MFIFVSVLISTTVDVDAQEAQQKRRFDRKEFVEKRNTFIITHVGLTEGEAKKVIPLYTEFQTKKFEIGKQCRTYSRELQTKKSVTDEEYIKVVNECIDVKYKEAQLETEYYTQFKKMLSPEKVYRLSQTESQFVREFMKKEGDRERNNRRK